MKNTAKKLLSLLLCACLLTGCLTAVAWADDIEITSAYDDVDWSAVRQYKTALHTHTNATDGDHTLRQSLQRHVETGFDIVAITDHGTVDRGWKAGDRNFIGKALKLVGRSEDALDYPGESGVFENGDAYRLETRGADDYLVLEDGREILRVPYGIENNAVSVNAHVNSWFVEYENNSVCDYEETMRGVDKAGGLCVINHPGEYTQARYELYGDDAYNEANPAYRYYIDKYYYLIDHYDACIGIDVNSKGDDRTRYDRKLWDVLLTRAAANGRSVTAIASSDAHQLDKIDTGSVVVLAAEKTSAALRDAIEKGRLLPQSTCVGSYEDLAAYAEAIFSLYGQTALYDELSAILDAYDAERDALARTAKKSNVGVKYKAIDDAGYFARETRPAVTNIAVDDAANTIRVDAQNALLVRWISGGEQIAVTKPGEAIDLDEVDGLGDYVRAEIFGEGGVIYTEAFLINAAEKTYTPARFFNIGAIDFLFAALDRFFRSILRVFGS